MIDTTTEEILSQSEARIEADGIEFSLDVSNITDALYSGLFDEMINYIATLTDRDPAYIGNWQITIKAKDIQF